MPNDIGLKEAKGAYDQAVQVRSGHKTVSEGVSFLVENLGMNPVSAGDMIRNLINMLGGELYHRTMNNDVTRFYFDQIRADFGDKYLRNALDSTRLHIDYYKSLPTGSGRPSLLILCDEFEASLS